MSRLDMMTGIRFSVTMFERTLASSMYRWAILALRTMVATIAPVFRNIFDCSCMRTSEQSLESSRFKALADTVGTDPDGGFGCEVCLGYCSMLKLTSTSASVASEFGAKRQCVTASCAAGAR